MSRLEELNRAVTAAIMEAERLELGGQDATEAYQKVTGIEIKLARELTLDTQEGRLARIGAVRAALKAGSHALALALLDQQYLEELGRAV